MTQGQDLSGRTLVKTYSLLSLLGRGGMGAVYRARHLRTGGLCAVKVLHREAADDPEIYRRFQDEARAASALRHPNIVQVMDFDREPDGTPLLVMELLDGEDLHHRLRQMGRLPLPFLLEVARQVGSALHAAHDHGVVHRDVKPQNIFLCRHQVAGETTEIAKVVDFGISKIRHADSQITQERTLLGTPHFMSPELARGEHAQLDGRADQFSLAVILYRALSGRLPFDGDIMGVLYQVVHVDPPPLRRLCPEVPVHVEAAIARAMSKRPEDRFPSMIAFVRALGGVSASGSLGPASGSFGQLQQTPPQTAMAPASSSTLREHESLRQTTTLSAATGHHLPARGRRALLGVSAGAVLGLALAGFLLTSARERGPRKEVPSAAVVPPPAPASPAPPDGGLALAAPAAAAAPVPAPAPPSPAPTRTVRTVRGVRAPGRVRAERSRRGGPGTPSKGAAGRPDINPGL